LAHLSVFVGPYVNGQLADWLSAEKVVTFPAPKNCDFGDLDGSIFHSLSDHFGDPGGQGVTKQARGGPGVHFKRFWGDLDFAGLSHANGDQGRVRWFSLNSIPLSQRS